MKIFCYVILIFLFVSNAFAADIYWVSTTGEANWASAESDTPLSGTSCCSLETSRTNAAAGDTVNIRVGTYTMRSVVGDTNWQMAFIPSNSGSSGNEITFQAYNNETVLFDNSVNAGKAYPVASYGVGWASVDGPDYIIFDGLDTVAALAGGSGGDGFCKGVTIHNSDHITVKNADIEACGTSSSGNSHAIRLENATYYTIENNVLHNSKSTDDYNNTAITSYESNYGEISNNTIYDCIQGIYFKTGEEYTDAHHNFIYSCNRGIGIAKASGGVGAHDMEIYQNVIINMTGAGIALTNSTLSHDNDIYNNSMYDVGVGLWSQDNEYYNYEFYNNLVVSSTLTEYYGTYSYYGENSTTDTFINSGGTDVEDYKRSSYPTDGRGGSYNDVIGAYLTGNETIGYTDDNSSTPTITGSQITGGHVH